jgi:chromosome segregation ATPase
MANGNFLKAGALAVLAVATASSFAAPNPAYFPAQRDTVPAEQNVFDKGLRQIDKAIEKLDATVSDPRWQQELNSKLQSAMEKLNNVKWEEELGRAMDKVNLEKIQQQMQESFSRVDMNKVKRDLSEALDKLDKAKIHAEIDKVDWEKMRLDLKKQLNEINTDVDFEKIRKDVDKAGKDAIRDLERAKKEGKLEMKVNMERMKADLKRQQSEMREEKGKIRVEMNKAHEQLETAREELKQYKAMTQEMENDGLIKQNGNYSIEYRDGKLSINGEKQSDKTTAKFKKYFSKNEVEIIKEGEKLTIK